MKNKCFYAAISYLILLAGMVTSCKKESTVHHTILTHDNIVDHDTISHHLYYNPMPIVTCGGSSYKIDLDLDGIPDAQLRLSCISGPFNTNVYCGPWTYIYTINVILDTILGSQFSPVSNMKGLTGGMHYGDTISQLTSVRVFNGDTFSQSSTQYAAQPLFLENSGGYMGFVKSTTNGDKYGWLNVYFDNQANLYVSGAAINNAPNGLIIAGKY